jgi:hypothetical protein
MCSLAGRCSLRHCARTCWVGGVDLARWWPNSPNCSSSRYPCPIPFASLTSGKVDENWYLLARFLFIYVLCFVIQRNLIVLWSLWVGASPCYALYLKWNIMQRYSSECSRENNVVYYRSTLVLLVMCFFLLTKNYMFTIYWRDSLLDNS